MSRKLWATVLAMLLAAPLATLLPSAQASTTNTYNVTSVPARLLTLDGGATTLSLGNDELPALFSLGFSTTFFGQSTSVFWVSSNGFITLINPHSPGGPAGGQSIPSTTDPTGFVAGFWSDLDPTQGGTIRFETLAAPAGSNATQVLVVDYANVPIHNQGGSNSFQIQVFNDGAYEVHWASVSSTNVTTTVGIENEAGTVGVQVEHGAVAHANEAIRFTPTTITTVPPPIGYTLVSLPFSPVTLDANATVFPPADTQSFQVALGFNTTFFNRSVSSVFVSEKGFVSLLGDPDPGCCQGQAIPDPASPNGLVAGFWTDLFTQSGGTLRTETLPAPSGTNASQVFVADYDAVHTFSTQVPESFQILVFDNGLLEVQLVNVQPDGSHIATIGIEDGTGSRALVAAHGSNLSFAGAAFAFVPDGVPVPTVPPGAPAGFEPKSGTPGTVLTVTSASNASFPNGAQVALDGTTLPTTMVTTHELQATVPNLAPGPANVSVLAQGNVVLAFADAFTVSSTGPAPNATPPTLADITPVSGLAGTHVLVSGSGFAQGSTLTIGGVQVPTTLDDGASLEADVPANLAPGVVSVIVTNPDGARAALHGGFLVVPPTPKIGAVTPGSGLVGQTFQVLGSGFAPGARVLLAGAEANVTSVTPTSITAKVPSAHGGLKAVAVVNPDGRTAILADAFTLQRGTRTDNVAPSLARAGGFVFLSGLGYTFDTAVLVDGVPQQVAAATPTQLVFQLARTTPKGVHDLTLVSGGVTERLAGALVVRWPANVAVGPITIEKGALTTDAGAVPGSDAALPSKISVQVTNNGDEPTGFFSVRVFLEEDSESPVVLPSTGGFQDLGRASFFGLPPGQTVFLNRTWDARGDVGDFRVLAIAQPQFDDLLQSDNVATARTSVVVGGFMGFGPCDAVSLVGPNCTITIPQPPPPPPPPPVSAPHLTERKIVREQRTNATDEHAGATASFSFISPHTSKTRFDFSSPTDILSSSSTAQDGTLTTCTVWRFESPQGSIQAFLDPDALSGRLNVPIAANRSSSGTSSTSTREQFYLFPDTKPVQTRDEDEGTSSTASTPQSSYSFPNASTIHVSATNVRGDFSQCISFPPTGSATERLAFAALPGNLTQPQPNFFGSGTLGDLRVTYVSDSTSTQTTLDEVPSDRDLTQGVTG